MSSFEKGTVVVLTRNHRAQLLRTLRALQQLPEAWPIIVVDNGSTDGTARAVGRQFPGVMLIRSRRNIGAAARNIAVAYAHTPYVAFTHDDSRWEPGALACAARILEEHASVAVVSACVKDAESGRVHPQCAEVARHAPLTDASHGGPVFGFTPDACVLRTRAFYEAGGVWPPFFEGGEENLLALDMAERGWGMWYCDDVVNWRQTSEPSERMLGRRWRNDIWTAWMRLPCKLAWSVTLLRIKDAARAGQLRTLLLAVAAGAGKVFKRRRVVSPEVAARWSQHHTDVFSGSQRLSPSGSRQSLV